jgi:hypothetical protein
MPFSRFKALIPALTCNLLFKAGTSARHVNSQLFSVPIHVAADEVKIDAIKLLLKYPNNKADMNAVNKLGLTAIHILLSKLLDFALLQNKQASPRPGKVKYLKITIKLS